MNSKENLDLLKGEKNETIKYDYYSNDKNKNKNNTQFEKNNYISKESFKETLISDKIITQEIIKNSQEYVINKIKNK